jgi:hypothetical protein
VKSGKVPIDAWDGRFALGLDPARRDYASFADFSDPDGNGWVLLERVIALHIVFRKLTDVDHRPFDDCRRIRHFRRQIRKKTSPDRKWPGPQCRTRIRLPLFLQTDTIHDAA